MANFRQAKTIQLQEYAAFSLEATYQGLGWTFPRCNLLLMSVNMPASGFYLQIVQIPDALRVRANSSLLLDLAANGLDFGTSSSDGRTDDFTDSNSGNVYITSLSERL